MVDSLIEKEVNKSELKEISIEDYKNLKPDIVGDSPKKLYSKIPSSTRKIKSVFLDG